MNAYSMDLGERVVAACDRGEGTREEIARRFRVDSAAAERLRQAVADRPDATLEELREAVGVACGPSAVHRALERLGLPRKKSRSGPPGRTTRI